MTKIKSIIKDPQVARFARLFIIALAAVAATKNGLTVAAIVGAAEVAFRQVFPA